MPKLKNKRRDIGLIVFPLRNPDVESGQRFIDQIIASISPSLNHVLVITGNYYYRLESEKLEIINVKTPRIQSKNESVWSKARRFLLAQYRLSVEIIRQRQKFEVLMLHMGAPYLIIPAKLSKLMGKKIMLVPTGSDSLSIRFIYRGTKGQIYRLMVRALEMLIYSLSDNIVVVSDSMIPALGMEMFRHKVISGVGNSPIGGACGFVSTDTFDIKYSLEERENLIGYIGRLSAEKGIIQFIEAVPLIIQKKPEARFLIVGDGDLMADLKLRIERSGCLQYVKFTGALPNDQIPAVLNRMKFLVVPSFTEVFAAAALEAMSCGTICLAAKVGAAKDIITEGETGFLLENNDSLTISHKLLQVWEDPRLAGIQMQARKLIEANFTQTKVSDKWSLILNKVL